MDRGHVRDLIKAHVDRRLPCVDRLCGVLVGGLSDLLKQTNHQRCTQSLLVSRCCDVERVGRPDEMVGIEIGVGGIAPRSIGVIGREHACGGGQD